MRILFWNTNRNENINTVLSELIAENNVSIVILAEYAGQKNELIAGLENTGISMKEYITIGSDRINMFGTLDNVYPLSQTKYTSLQNINGCYLICGVHFPSRIHSDHNEKRNLIIRQLLYEIEKKEIEFGTEKTIIVGDFNINPYENGCLSAENLHGIPVKSIAERSKRTIMGIERKMFYNPMWNFLGDSNTPPGTYFYGGNDTYNPFWNIYDQVIIRPALIPNFVYDELKILTRTKSTNLMNRDGYPDKTISDHFPILFEIRED